MMSEEHTENQVDEEKKKSKLATFLSNATHATKVKYDAHKDMKHEIKKNKELFESESIRFTMVSDTNRDHKIPFFGLKSMADSSILVQFGITIRAGMIVSSLEGTFRIVDVDLKHEIDFPSDGSSQYPIKCYKCKYEMYVAPAHNTINQTQNQSIVIQGNNSGDISQVAKQQFDLEEIKNAINGFNPSFLQRKKKEEAIELYGNFKNCIINKQKDETIFKKFLEILKTVAPAVITLATNLISAL